MSNEHKAVCLEALASLRGDDLYRAKATFARYTPEQMNKPYGQSNMTPTEMLAGYEAHEAKVLAAKCWLEGL